MARGKTIYFLITYDTLKRQMISMETTRDGKKAVANYGPRESEYADRPHIHVVLLGADSEEAIRVTHPIYFDTRSIEEVVADMGEPPPLRGAAAAAAASQNTARAEPSPPQRLNRGLAV